MCGTTSISRATGCFQPAHSCRTTLLNQYATVLCRGPSTQGAVDGRIRPANGTGTRYLKRLSALMQVKLDALFPVSLIISYSYRAVLLRTRPSVWSLSLALHHHPCRLSKSRHSLLYAIGEAACRIVPNTEKHRLPGNPVRDTYNCRRICRDHLHRSHNTCIPYSYSGQRDREDMGGL